MKNYLKTIAFVAVMGMAGLGTVAADQWDKKTVITTDEVMQLPHTTLQPGTYVIRLAESEGNRHIVQFFDKDEKHLITTVLAIPNERLRLTGKSVFAFWEVPAGQPKALRAWFYPGDSFGQEFAYPRQEADKITASNSGATVPVNDQPVTTASDNSTKTETATAVQEPAPAPAAEPIAAAEPPAPVEVAAAQQPAPEPAVAPAPVTPAPTTADTSDAQQISQASQQPDTLPKTASNLPWVGLIGLLSMVSALALNLAYRRS